jgi:tripeptidyl-peptidase I
VVYIRSHPASPNYARHWTSDEVIAMFEPSEKTVAIVREWLVLSGISAERITHSDNKAWLAFDATTEEAEALLHAEYHEYEHTSNGKVAAACDAYV